MCQTSARVVHTLTLEHERAAEMNAPPVQMASVAIRLPQPLEVSQHENKCKRDDKRKAFHTYRRALTLAGHPPRRHGILRNDAVVCLGADDGGTATAAAGVDGAEATGHKNVMGSGRNFKNKKKDDDNKTQ